jgi:hypothetical protein
VVIFWDITPCRPSEVNPGVEESSAYYLLAAGFLLAVFDPEDGGDMFLRQVYILEDWSLPNPGFDHIRCHSLLTMMCE